jgi:hypothetical protein
MVGRHIARVLEELGEVLADEAVEHGASGRRGS